MNTPLFIRHSLLFSITRKKKMVTSIPGALVKELNIVNKHWNLCNLFLKNINIVYFNTKFAYFSFFN
jgi:hypothetical protein